MFHTNPRTSRFHYHGQLLDLLTIRTQTDQVSFYKIYNIIMILRHVAGVSAISEGCAGKYWQADRLTLLNITHSIILSQRTSCYRMGASLWNIIKCHTQRDKAWSFRLILQYQLVERLFSFLQKCQVQANAMMNTTSTTVLLSSAAAGCTLPKRILAVARLHHYQ